MKDKYKPTMTEISPKNHLLKFNFKDLWDYKDLVYYFVKRDFISIYKQTILGPLWYIIQPFMTSNFYTYLFKFNIQ